MAKALSHIHAKGLVHLDLKPDNIYVLDGVFKLGDFGCATRIDGSLSFEEGDARYIPLEFLNEDYTHLCSVDMFSLGASIYELATGVTLPSSGPTYKALREGKLAVPPGFSSSFENLLKVGSQSPSVNVIILVILVYETISLACTLFKSV